MKLKVSVTKRNFFMALVALFILGGSFVVFAFGGNNPVEFGHSGEEVEVLVGGGPAVDLNTIVASSSQGVLDCQLVSQDFGSGPFGSESFNLNSLDCSSLGSEYNVMGGGCYDYLTTENAPYDGLYAFIVDHWGWACRGSEDVNDDFHIQLNVVCCK